MILTSWNVNGLRSVSTKGFDLWFMQYLPDVIALQEIKSTNEDVEHLIKEWSAHYETHLFPAKKKGYSGTALLIKRGVNSAPIVVKRGLGLDEYDDEGRLIWAEFPGFFFINGYFPNGKRDHSRVDYKLDFSRRVVELAHTLQRETKKEVIICGDLNTAHTEIDLANPKSNSKTTGFLPHERAFVDEMINGGLVDLFRTKYPGEKGKYTWWTYRGDCREKNIGWRLDYFFSTKGIVDKVLRVEHQTHVTGSDHCPILLEIKI